MHRDPTTLQNVWFLLICVLWIGYFILEGFDFGVGMLLRSLGRDKHDRRAIIHTIGPVWDGNEVWLLVAGGATFAAFPGWYASLFSGAYLALFLILAALIVRGVAFEFWGKVDTDRWRSAWEWSTVVASGAAALLWGVAWANIVHGVPMNARHDVTGSLLDLLGPYALLGGLATFALFLSHGAIFLTLRTKGELVERARRVARGASPVAAVLLAAFLAWTVVHQSDRGGIEAGSTLFATLAVVLAALVPARVARGRDGQAFALSAGTIAVAFVALFLDLYPNALPSTTNGAFTLTLFDASSTHYTLVVMTVVAVLLVPLVLAYQAWTYWVFRHRLGRDDFATTPTPMTMVQHAFSGRFAAEGAAPAAPVPAEGESRPATPFG